MTKGAITASDIVSARGTCLVLKSPCCQSVIGAEYIDRHRGRQRKNETQAEWRIMLFVADMNVIKCTPLAINV